VDDGDSSNGWPDTLVDDGKSLLFHRSSPSFSGSHGLILEINGG